MERAWTDAKPELKTRNDERTLYAQDAECQDVPKTSLSRSTRALGRQLCRENSVPAAGLEPATHGLEGTSRACSSRK